MEGVMLLSELHPLASLDGAFRQAKEWFGLLTQNDIAELQKPGSANYTKAIMLIELRCRERGATLILRDWAHLDYTGYPYLAPGYRPLLYTELAESFDIVRISTTRDPVTPMAESDSTGHDAEAAPGWNIRSRSIPCWLS